MRTLHLTNVQFDVLRDIVKDVIDELKCDLDEETLYTTETYKIYSQLDRLQSSKVIVTDDDYADKVDTLVGNMVASDDNEEEELPELSIQEQLDYVKSRLTIIHDSEGC